jgi:8-oxo-dGTP pyrophosphatase MutT (NUDIX family)
MTDDNPDAFLLTLPRRRAGSGALIVNTNGRLLLVEPRYKSTWEIPGGIVESGEDPRTACAREIREEIGLDIRPGRLLVLEHQTDPPPRGDSIMFVYDGGTLTDDAPIRLRHEELLSYRFVDAADLASLLNPRLANRMHHALCARADGTTVELSSGTGSGTGSGTSSSAGSGTSNSAV